MTKRKQKYDKKGRKECRGCMPALWHSPSSSSSAVMDFERSVRVVLGALLGGGGAVETRHGVEDEVEGDENPLALRLSALLASPRRPAHPILTALIWLNSEELDASHLARTLFRLRLEPSFFMFFFTVGLLNLSVCVTFSFLVFVLQKFFSAEVPVGNKHIVQSFL